MNDRFSFLNENKVYFVNVKNLMPVARKLSEMYKDSINQVQRRHE